MYRGQHEYRTSGRRERDQFGQHRVEPGVALAFAWEFHRGRKTIVVPTTAPLLLNEVGTLHGVCLSGYGIVQTFSLGVGAWLADGQLIDLFPDWPDERFPLDALYASRQHPSAKTRAFIDFVATLA